MKKTERKKRRAYLDDFTRDADGEYRYAGSVYELCEGGVTRRGFLARIAVCFAVTVLCTAGQGTLPAPGTDNSPFVLIPFAASVIALLVLLWAEAGILFAEYPMREYKLTRYVKSLWRRSVVFAAIEAAVAVGEAVYLIVSGTDGKLPGAFALFAMCALGAASALYAGNTARRAEWNKIVRTTSLEC